jgi:hypothetical protein
MNLQILKEFTYFRYTPINFGSSFSPPTPSAPQDSPDSHVPSVPSVPSVPHVPFGPQFPSAPPASNLTEQLDIPPSYDEAMTNFLKK